MQSAALSSVTQLVIHPGIGGLECHNNRFSGSRITMYELQREPKKHVIFDDMEHYSVITSDSNKFNMYLEKSLEKTKVESYYVNNF